MKLYHNKDKKCNMDQDNWARVIDGVGFFLLSVLFFTINVLLQIKDVYFSF